MTDKILDDDSTGSTPSFEERWLLRPLKIGQIVFDFLFGIVMPILCFYFDPGIIRDDLSPVTSFSPLRLFIYVFSGLAIPTLALWLLLGRRLNKYLSGIIGGTLLTGAIICFMIGCLILPLTLAGLAYIIGFLGFIPFITTYVYARNGLRAMAQANARMPRRQLVALLLLGVTLIISIPAAVQWKVSQMVSESVAVILRTDAQPADDTVDRLKHLGWLVDTWPIIEAYDKPIDSTRKERLAKLYKEITGEDLQARLSD